MKVFYDYSIFTHQRLGGVSRYFINLIENLNIDINTKIAAPIHYNIFLKNFDKKNENIYIKKFPSFTSKIINIYNKKVTQIKVNNFKPDIYHKTYYNNFWPYSNKVRNVITVYDLIHEIFYKDFGKDKNFRPKKNSLERADAICCISNNTKKDLIEYYKIEPSKIFVTHLGLNYFPDIISEKILNFPYILFVGSKKRYKNFENLLIAYCNSKKINSNYKLVVFGGEKTSEKEKKILIDKNISLDQIIETSGGDDVLANLYKNASIFVFPSKYEGFGLPLLEAASKNCPLACSDIDVFREVIQEGAAFFNPNSVDDISNVLEKILFSETSQKILVKKSNEIIKNFTWDKCAKETLNIYKSII